MILLELSNIICIICREDCISIEILKKKKKKLQFEKFQGYFKPFHSFRSYDTHKSPIEHLEVWMTPGNFPIVPQQVDAYSIGQKNETALLNLFVSYLLLLSGYATPVVPPSTAHTLPPIRVL